MTFRWATMVEDRAKAICKELTGSEDKWEDHISAAINAELADTLKPKTWGPQSEQPNVTLSNENKTDVIGASGYYKLVEDKGEPYRAGTVYGEWQWWRPIETAPKDGTTLLGWIPDYGFCVMYWNERALVWAGPEGQYFPAKFWMPLPEPPEEEESK